MSNGRVESGVEMQKPVVVAFLALAPCASTSFGGTLVASSVDGGGGRSSSPSYVNDGCLGGIAGIEAAGADTNRAGYIGQLTEVASLSMAATPASVSECSNSQFSTVATLDDRTVVMLTGADVSWNSPAFPLASIHGSGLATMAAVYTNTPGAFTGQYLGTAGSGAVMVLNTLPDNYGIYANDSIPDWWQVAYFGTNNPLGLANADADGTGQNNLFKYVAGLDPTNPASVFRFRIESVPGQPTQENLVFSPRYDGHTYVPLFRTDLVAGASWTPLTTTNLTDNGPERTVTDLSASGIQKFYRIQISYP